VDFYVLTVHFIYTLWISIFSWTALQPDPKRDAKLVTETADRVTK